MTSPVTPDRVREIIAAYGGAPQRWPEAERLNALALIARDPALAALREQARGLDDVLDAQPAPPVLQVNPIAIAAAARRGQSGRGTGGGLLRPTLLRRAAGMAAVALLGFALGISGVASFGSRALPDDPIGTQIEEDAL